MKMRLSGRIFFTNFQNCDSCYEIPRYFFNFAKYVLDLPRT